MIILLFIASMSMSAYSYNPGGRNFTLVTPSPTPSLIPIRPGMLHPLLGLTPVAYVTNSMKNNDVVAVEMNNNTVIATIHVGSAPVGLAVSPDGSRVYVAESGSNMLAVINTSTNTAVADIPVGNMPYAVAVSPDGKGVYVSNNKDNTVSIIDTSTNTVTGTVNVGKSPWGLKANPGNGDVYVLNSNDGTISVIRGAGVVATIPVGKNPMIGLAFSSDGKRLYVANVNSNNVSVIDTAGNAVVNSISTGNNPYGIVMSPDGTLMYVTLLGDQKISAIKTSDFTVSGTLDAKYPAAIAIRPDAKVLYASDVPDGCVQAIDANTGSQMANLSFGDYVGDIAVVSLFSPSGVPQLSPTPVPPTPTPGPSPTPAPSVVSVTPGVSVTPTVEATPTQNPTETPGTATASPSASQAPRSISIDGFEAWLGLAGLISAIYIAIKKD